MLTVKNLENIEFETIIDCFLKSFKNYSVKMPTDINYYKERWKIAKVDFNLSYGMFEGRNLIGFIINAIDERNGIKIAFNTGTGVLPKFRGKRIIKSIYNYAIPDLKRNGITKCSLEVLTDNIIAIKSYQSSGFKICKTYECYKGDINIKPIKKSILRKVKFDSIDWDNLPNQDFYSWDFQSETIKNGSYSYYQLIKDNSIESYFIINPNNKFLAQFEVLKENIGSWSRLFNEIKNISKTIRVINVDTRLIEKIKFIKFIGLSNTVNQYEMEMEI